MSLAKESGKAISTVSLITGAMDLFKTVAIVFVMSMLEFAKKKQAQAEFEKDVAENELEIEREANEIRNEDNSKDSADIIDDFLDESDGEGE